MCHLLFSYCSLLLHNKLKMKINLILINLIHLLSKLYIQFLFKFFNKKVLVIYKAK